MVVCDRIPAGFVEQVERQRGRFASVGGGLWRGEMAGFLLHGVETCDACRASPREHLLYAFSRAFLTNAAGFPPLDEEGREVYALIYQQVEQFRRRRGDMAIRDREALKKSYEAALKEFLAQMPPEERLKGLTPEQIANALPPDKGRLAGLTPEQIATLFTSDEALNALSPEAREELRKKLER
jgi:hypothetical protein